MISRLSKRKALAFRLAALAVGLWLISDTLLWATVRAQWNGSTSEVCTTSGACWTYIGVYWNRFLYGSYPEAERWRVHVVAIMMLVIVGLGFWKRRYLTYRSALAAAVVAWMLSAVVLLGGIAGLSPIDQNSWGGFFLTISISLTAMIMSLVLGIPLAFMRMSSRPVLNMLARLYIELWRAIPLVMVLFLAVSLLPLFLPPGMELKRLTTVLIAFSLYYSAYMAEVIRAGIRALPSGQREAAYALGLSKWRTRDLVIIPQALRVAVPSIVNILIAVFKDTTLVLIVGMFDLLGMVQQSLRSPEWGRQSLEGYLFVAGIMWFFCFTLSRASTRLEYSSARS